MPKKRSGNQRLITQELGVDREIANGVILRRVRSHEIKKLYCRPTHAYTRMETNSSYIHSNTRSKQAKNQTGPK